VLKYQDGLRRLLLDIGLIKIVLCSVILDQIKISIDLDKMSMNANFASDACSYL
jgi:hypothetical protein